MARRGQRPDRCSPSAAAHPAPGPRHGTSSRCSPAPCARSRRPSQRGPVRRPCAPSSRPSRCWCARSGPGSRPTRPQRGAARRAAQAARRHRDDPGQDRRPRHLACFALLAEDAVVSDAAAALQARDAARPPASRPARRRPPAPAPAPDRRRPARRAPGRAAVGDRPAAGQPVPRPRLLRAADAGPRPAPARRLGAARPAAPLLRVRRRRRPVLHAAARADDRCRRPAAWS